MPDLFAPSSQPGSLATAGSWIEALLRSEAVTAIAVLAIAFVGYGMLAGRLSVRHAFRVVLGCFILFSAPAIAVGLIGTARDTEGSHALDLAPPLPPASLPAVAPEAAANPFDPYASNGPPD